MKAAQIFGDAGVEVSVTAPYTSEENGRAERMNRTIMSSVHSMMTRTGAPEVLWAECLQTAATCETWLSGKVKRQHQQNNF